MHEKDTANEQGVTRTLSNKYDGVDFAKTVKPSTISLIIF